MPQSSKPQHPARLAVFEGLTRFSELDEAFQKDLGIEEALVVIPQFLEGDSLGKSDPKSPWLNDRRIEWIIGAKTSELPSRFYHALTKRNRHFIMKASAFIESELSKKAPEYFAESRKHFNDICELIASGRGYLESSLLAIRNTIDNLDLIEANPGVNQLHNLFRGLPAVVVSTGPSLTKSLPDLKKIQDQCILIAADASLKILLAAGIKPHLVCTIERDEGTLDFYKGALKNFTGEKPHIVTFSLAPRSVVNEMTAPLWFGYRNMSYFGFFEAQVPRGVIAAGHSVAHFCARLAGYLGCSQIVLVGQDLAYDPESFTSHPMGFAYAEMSERTTLEGLKKKIEARGEKLLYVSGNLHPEVPTSTFYQMFLREFEVLVRDIGIPVKNATIGGARIEGTEFGNLLDFTRDWKVIANPTQTLDIQHARKRDGAKFDLVKLLSITHEPLEIVRQCSEILTRQMPHLQDLNSRSVLSTIAHQLRGVQRRLIADEIFKALTVDLVGTRFVEIENSMALLWDQDEQNLPNRLAHIIEWFSECRIAIEGFQALVSESESKNKPAVGS